MLRLIWEFRHSSAVEPRRWPNHRRLKAEQQKNAEDQDQPRGGQAFQAQRLRDLQTQRLPPAAHIDQKEHQAHAPPTHSQYTAQGGREIRPADDPLLLTPCHSVNPAGAIADRIQVEAASRRFQTKTALRRLLRAYRDGAFTPKRYR